MPKMNIYLIFYFDPLRFVIGIVVSFWAEQTQKAVIVYTIELSSTGIKQFLYFTH